MTIVFHHCLFYRDIYLELTENLFVDAVDPQQVVSPAEPTVPFAVRDDLSGEMGRDLRQDCELLHGRGIDVEWFDRRVGDLLYRLSLLRRHVDTELSHGGDDDEGEDEKKFSEEELGKSVLENAPFHGSSSVYWVHRNGGLTQTDIVKGDIDMVIAHSYSPQSFMQNMIDMGYRFNRGIFNEYPSIYVPGRNKPIRLKSFGEEYTQQRILQRIYENRYTRPPKIKFYFPVYRIYGKRKPTWADSILVLFEALLAILEQMLAKPEEKQLPISPELRFEMQKLDKYIKQQEFLTAYKLETVEELSSFIGTLQSKTDELLEQRKQLDNKIRRAATPEIEAEYKAERRKLSGELAVVREDIATAKDIEKESSRLVRILENEYALEVKQKIKNREMER